jgi:hypothetical protein
MSEHFECILTCVCHLHADICNLCLSAGNFGSVVSTRRTEEKPLKKLFHRRSPRGEVGELEVRTRILLSRHGTQAVVTCFREAFLGLSGSGDMVTVPLPR